MITFEEALSIVLENSSDFGVEEVSLDKSMGRVLKEDIVADRDMPPFNRVTMDGIAIKGDARSVPFKIEGIAPAGSPQIELSSSENCIEVMTGAILPKNTDAVIRYEDLEIKDGYALLSINKVVSGQNIHKKGEDRKKGDVVVTAGSVIGTPEIGVAASLGRDSLKVNKWPKIAIISTGDELVEIDSTPEPYQIRKSNVHQIKLGLLDYGVEADVLHIDDNYEEIVLRLKKYLNDYDVLLLSGGVSKGKFDFLPKALDELGVEKKFHRVMQRPGKPFWFGKLNTHCTIFAFPGNPVSSFMCYSRYFLPWLNKSVGKPQKDFPIAKLVKDINFAPDLTYFPEVRLSYNDMAELEASPILGNGSGDFANLVDADAFIQLPRGKNIFKKGEKYPVIRFRN